MAIFSEQQWAKIARSIPIEELSRDLRKEISDALFAYELGIIAGDSEGRAEAQTDNRSERRSRHKKVSKVTPDARKRQALQLLRESLKRLEKFARDTRLTLSGIQVDLRPESLINKVEALIEELYGVQRPPS